MGMKRHDTLRNYSINVAVMLRCAVNPEVCGFHIRPAGKV
jgi:hypothetical protein